MDHLQYPVGMSSFPELITGGYIYVDKTQYIKPLLRNGKFKFLSRPRRFGKSLLLSTLEAYFEGQRDLFKGLAVDSMGLDWTPSPVLRFDLNTGKYDDQNGLENRLKVHLEKYEKKYEITPRTDLDNALRFENIISEVYEKTGREVVILIDEYDKPLLDIEEKQGTLRKEPARPQELLRKPQEHGPIHPIRIYHRSRTILKSQHIQRPQQPERHLHGR